MTCEHAAALAEQLESGGLEEHQRAALERHLAGCEHCSNLYGWQLQLSALLREGLEEPPPGFAAAVMARIAAEPAPGTAPTPAPGRRGPRVRARWMAGLAAAVLLVAIAPTALKTLRLAGSTQDLSAPESAAEGAAPELFSGALQDDSPTGDRAPGQPADDSQMADDPPSNPPSDPADSALSKAERLSPPETSAAADGAQTPSAPAEEQQNAVLQTENEAGEAGEADSPAEAPMVTMALLPDSLADALPEPAPETRPQSPAGAGAASAAGAAQPEQATVAGAAEIDWIAILPTALLQQPEDVAEVQIQETPPEQYEEHIAAEGADYYVLQAEQGYLLIVVYHPE